MKRCGVVLCFVSFLLFADAKSANAAQWAFRVTFANKNGTSSLNNPSAFLSQRALDRRAVHGIAVDSADLPVSPVYINDVLSSTNGILHVTSKWLNDCVILLSDSAQIANLQNKPYVTSVKYIAHYTGTLHSKNPDGGQGKFANEQLTPVHTAPKGTGQPAFYNLTWGQTTMLNGDCLHDLNFKGQGKLIAVLDQGFTEVDVHPGFDSLRQSGRLLETYNFVKKTTGVYGFSDHGTQVLSTVAGYVPNTFIGSAPLAQIILYITEDTQSEQPIEMDNMAAATERADSMGADIVTSSLGYNIFDDFPAASLTYADLNGVSTIAAQAANWAVRKGILFVITAGNEGGNAWNHILTPGDADSALTVGAVDGSKNPAPFSGFGPNSNSVVKPDICSQGDPANVFTTGGGYFTSNGTSFATPQVAGWAACIWQANPGATPSQVRNAIRENADHYNNPGTQIGYGVPNFCAAKNTLAQLVAVNELTPASTGAINVYPTYLHSETTLSIVTNAGRNENASFILADINGRIIAVFKTSIKEGYQNNAFTIPAGLSAGVYIFKALTESGDYTSRLVKY